MATGNDIIAGAKSTYREIDSATALQLLQEANDYILRFARIYPDQVVDINFSAGEQEKALSDDVLRIHDQAFGPSTSDLSELTQTSKSYLDAKHRGWRRAQRSNPTFMYDEGGYVGLYPTPNANGVLRLYASTRQILVGATVLPGFIREQTEAWEDEIVYRWAKHAHRDEIREKDQIRRASLKKLLEFLYGRNLHDKPSADMNVPPVFYP